MRTLRHGVSGEGIAEVSALDGAAGPPAGMGQLPPGRTRGALDARFYGMRVCSDTLTHTAFQLLGDGAYTIAKQ